MKTNITTKKLILSALTFLLGTYLGHSAAPTTTVDVGSTATQDLMIESGQTVVLSAKKQDIARIPSDKILANRYHWAKNGFLITHATNETYALTNVSTNDAATYTLFVSGAHGQAQSAPVHLSVYTLNTNQSNGGTLTVPIGAFTFSSQQVSCSPKTFNYYKAYVPFDGPNMTPPSPTFPNTSQSSKLVISTCSTANSSTLDTAVKVQQNWMIPPNPPLQVACSDDASAACGPNPLLSICTNNLLAGKTYRMTLYYIGSTLGNNTTVTFSWNYQNY